MRGERVERGERSVSVNSKERLCSVYVRTKQEEDRGSEKERQRVRKDNGVMYVSYP